MMRSLSSAVAGLRTHQTKMDVIGNNIANVNTYGFKSSRATFSDVYYQTLSGAASPRSGTGGTNPTQIGYGSSVATIDTLMAVSGGTTTDRALDVYITGDGFLVTQDNRGNYLYTRLGNLGFDSDGNLVDPSGNYVQGFPMTYDEDGNYVPNVPSSGVADGDNIEAINVSPEILDKLTGISISTTGEIIGTLEGGAKVTLSANAKLASWIEGATINEDATVVGDIIMVNSALITTTSLTTAFTTAGGTASAGFQVTDIQFGGDLAISADRPVEIYFEGGKMYLTGESWDESSQTFQKLTVYGELDSKGNITLANSSGKVLYTLKTNAADNNLTMPKPASSAVAGHKDNPAVIAVGTNLVQSVQLMAIDKGGNKITSGPPTAIPAGTSGTQALQDLTLVEGVTIKYDNDPAKIKSGNVYKTFAGKVATAGNEEGERFYIGQLVLAKFRNDAALEQVGNSQYKSTNNTGEAVYVMPGNEGTGSTKANMLETSNVDISKEFTEMITTQRGFQANTRIVTVSDEMLQELVNLKR